MRKITLLVGGAVGYVLGTRAGRERYEQIVSQAKGLWENPKVQEQANKAQSLAKQKGSEVQDKVQDKVSSSGDNGSSQTVSATVPEPVGDPLAVGDPLGRDEVGGFTEEKATYPTTSTSTPSTGPTGTTGF